MGDSHWMEDSHGRWVKVPPTAAAAAAADEGDEGDEGDEDAAQTVLRR